MAKGREKMEPRTIKRWWWILLGMLVPLAGLWGLLMLTPEHSRQRILVQWTLSVVQLAHSVAVLIVIFLWAKYVKK